MAIKRAATLAGGFCAAAVVFTVLLYACGAVFRPDVSRPPPERSASAIAAAQKTRREGQRLNLAAPPVITREVDYPLGAGAAWWPRSEAPILAELVREGHLPPVAERVGAEPVVMEGVDGIGRYGGTWYRYANSTIDLNTIFWRLSGSNLVRWSPQGYPIVPHVAKSWTVSSDFCEYVFTLRAGMRWSDGHPLTADDILYWYNDEVGYFDLQPRNLLRSGSTLGRLEKVDDWRVKFIFSEPNPLFLERLASTSMNYEDFTEHIVPAHYLRKYHPAFGDQELIRRAMQALNITSRIALYKHIKHYLNPEHPRLWPWVPHTFRATPPQIFVRNPYYWCVDTQGNQLPYLDRLVMDVRTTDLIAVGASNGEPSMQDRHIRYEDYTLLMDNAARNGYSVYHWKQSTQSSFAIFPNLNRRVDPRRPETRWKHELLNEARFRQALSLAIDRREIIRAEFHDDAEPAQIAPPPDSPYHHPRLRNSYIAYDPTRANALLDELGLTRRDGEGFRTFPDGSRMSFALNLSDYAIQGPAQFVIDDWAAVGVRVAARTRARRLFEQEKLTFEHDFTVWTGESEFYPLVEPRNFVPTYFEAFYAPGFGAWYQYGGMYRNPAARRPSAIEPPEDHPIRRAMRLLDETLVLPTEQERIEHFSRVMDIAAEQVWTISIASPPPQLVVVKNGFRNVPRTVLFGGNFQSPANCGIETYFWAEPREDAATVAQTKRAVIEITPEPGLADVGSDAPPSHRGGSALGALFRWALGLSAAAAVVLLGLRHPLIGRRLMLMIPTLGAVSVIVFVLVQLPPGDFAQVRVSRLEMQGTAESDALAAELRQSFHLDEPLVDRYLRWSGLRWFTTFDSEDMGLLQGNLGLSMEHEKPVSEVVGDRILLTLAVSLLTVLFTWAVALPAGIYSAVRQYSVGDYVLTFCAFLAMSIPSFLLALVTLYVAKRGFGLNVSGLFSPQYATMPGWSGAKLLDLLRHIWLPVMVLGFGSAAGMIRVMRANLLDELKKPYVTTARAKGVRPLRLLLKYPVRLALNPFVSGLGGLFPQLVSGGAIVAMVLSLPMIGPTLLDALIAEDVYLAGSMLMVLSALGMLGTLVGDLLLLWLDPRIRLERGSR